MSFQQLGMTDAALYIALVMLPVLVIWMVFGYVSQYLSNRDSSRGLTAVFRQLKKNQDYSDLLARVLIEAEQQIRDGFMLNRFDLLIGDMNELLSEIIYNCSLASPEQIERLWNKVQNGGKWSFGKVIIEVNHNQPDFQMRIFNKAARDPVLGGTVMEFCARYQEVTAMLERHDKEKVFLNMIETGVMGKVFSILAPVADEIRRSRESESLFHRQAREQGRPASQPDFQTAKLSAEARAPLYMGEPQKPSFLSKIFKKKDRSQEEAEPNRNDGPDPLSIALERSFGYTETEPVPPSVELPTGEEEPAAPSLPEPGAEAENDRPMFFAPEEEGAVLPAEETPEVLTATQKTLNDLKKEWENMRGANETEEKAPLLSEKEDAPATPEEEEKKTVEEEAAFYPFSGWTDENSYQK